MVDAHCRSAGLPVPTGTRLSHGEPARSEQEVVFDDVTSGAQSDLQQATLLAREMVGRWGMSEAVGLVAVLGTEGAGWGPWSGDGPSEKTRELVETEVRALTDAAYDEARELLHAHIDKLAALAQALLALDARRARRLCRRRDLAPRWFTESAHPEHGPFTGHRDSRS